jgi:endonuclease YncB( thermonuclease family)
MLGAESSYQSISNADVVDGNTLRAEINYKTATIRLEGVQCPKKGEPGYEEAKSILEELTKEELLLLWGYSSDLAISSVKLKRYDGKDINKEVVRLGPCRALEGD